MVELERTRTANSPARRSTSARRSSCRQILFDKLGLPAGAQDAQGPAIDRRGRARRARAASTTCRASSSSTAPGEAQEHLHRQAARADQRRAPAASTPPTTRRSRRPGGCRRPIPTCRTSRSAPPEGAASARRSSRRRATASLAADYSQIELRIMAHLSADDGCCGAFAGGADVHRATAAEVFGVPLDEVTADQRALAKAINFGLMYGMSALRPRATARHRPRRRAGLHRAVFRSLPRREATTWTTPATARAQAGLCRNRVRPPPVPAGDQLAQRAATPIRRTQRDQRADAGHRGGHHQARDDGGGRLAVATPRRRAR